MHQGATPVPGQNLPQHHPDLWEVELERMGSKEGIRAGICVTGKTQLGFLQSVNSTTIYPWNTVQGFSQGIPHPGRSLSLDAAGHMDGSRMQPEQLKIRDSELLMQATAPSSHAELHHCVTQSLKHILQTHPLHFKPCPDPKQSPSGG